MTARTVVGSCCCLFKNTFNSFICFYINIYIYLFLKVMNCCVESFVFNSFLSNKENSCILCAHFVRVVYLNGLTIDELQVHIRNDKTKKLSIFVCVCIMKQEELYEVN